MTDRACEMCGYAHPLRCNVCDKASCNCPTADLYLRLSEDKYGDELGIGRQYDECAPFATGKGWRIRHVWADNDVSATTGAERPAFEALLKASPERVLCWHTDRFVRRNVDLERVIALGFDVHAIHAGHLDLSNPAGRAVARTVTAWAQYEGEQKSERQKAKHRQRVKTGKPWWPTRPFGFEMDGTHREDEARAIREAYDFILTGGAVSRAAKRLNASGMTTPKGNQWTPSGLRDVLLNARNAGIYVYKGTKGKDGKFTPQEMGKAAWDPIVSEEVYRATVKVLTDPARRKRFVEGAGFNKAENLLSGIAKCGKCQATVRAAWRRNKDGERTYKVYQCSGCLGSTLPAEWCDENVKREVLQHIEQWRGALPKDDGSEVAALRVLEGQKIEQRNALADMERINPEAVASLRASIDEELASLGNRIAEAGKRDSGRTSIKAIASFIDDLDKFRPVLKEWCEGITLNGPGKGGLPKGTKPRVGVHLIIDFVPPSPEVAAELNRQRTMVNQLGIDAARSDAASRDFAESIEAAGLGSLASNEAGR